MDVGGRSAHKSYMVLPQKYQHSKYPMVLVEADEVFRMLKSKSTLMVLMYTFLKVQKL